MSDAKSPSYRRPGSHLEDVLFLLRLSTTNQSRSDWFKEFDVLPDQRDKLADAAILLLPWKDEESKALAFPAGNTEFYMYLQDKLGESQVGICPITDDYHEIDFHSRTIRLGLALVAAVALEVVVTVIADYIIENLKADPKRDKVELELIVENKEGDSTIFRYEGPAEGLPHRILSEAVARDIIEKPEEQ